MLMLSAVAFGPAAGSAAAALAVALPPAEPLGRALAGTTGGAPGGAGRFMFWMLSCSEGSCSCVVSIVLVVLFCRWSCNVKSYAIVLIVFSCLVLMVLVESYAIV